MQTNALPAYDHSDNTTSCCPRFNPEGWDTRNLHFEDKLFVRAVTQSVDYVPTDMAEVFTHTMAAMEKAGALSPDNVIVLSRDISPFECEHFFAISKPVPGEEMVHWTGDYKTKVFEGPYEDAPNWQGEFNAELAQEDKQVAKNYFFYTTCPKCAETYGKNYVVAVAELEN